MKKLNTHEERKIVEMLNRIVTEKTIEFNYSDAQLFNGIVPLDIDGINNLKKHGIFNNYNLNIEISYELYSKYYTYFSKFLQYFFSDSSPKNIFPYILDKENCNFHSFLNEMVRNSIVYSPEIVVEQISEWKKSKQVSFRVNHYISGLVLQKPRKFPGLVLFPARREYFPELLIGRKISNNIREQIIFPHGQGVIASFEITGSFIASDKDKCTIENSSHYSNYLHEKSHDFNYIFENLCDNFCVAICLMYGSYCERVFSWIDTSDNRLFNNEIRQIFQNRKASIYSNSNELVKKGEYSQAHLHQTYELFKNIVKLDMTDRQKIGVNSWLQSFKDPEDSTGIFYMRVALESIFLTGDEKFVSSNLAVNISRNLISQGESFEELVKFGKTIKKFYYIASNIVHGGHQVSEVQYRDILIFVRLKCSAYIKRMIENDDRPKLDYYKKDMTLLKEMEKYNKNKIEKELTSISKNE